MESLKDYFRHFDLGDLLHTTFSFMAAISLIMLLAGFVHCI